MPYSDDIMRRIHEPSYLVFTSRCPGSVMEEMRNGVPWFGIKLSWLRNEFAFRLLILFDDMARADAWKRTLNTPYASSDRDSEIRAAYWRNMQGYGRSYLGPPYFLLSDLFIPLLTKLPPIGGTDCNVEYKHGWQWRYLRACFTYRCWGVIKKIYRLRPWS